MFPDVPTMVESGYPDFIYDGWLGALAPAGVSDEVVKVLSNATSKVLANEAFRQRMQSSGHVIIENTPKEVHDRIAKEGEQLRGLVERANLRQP